MLTVKSVVLGLIQGLTEFLPVSSSGHLVIMQNLFGFTEPELLLDISLHVGTLLAVCVVFFPEIRSILQTVFQLPRLYKNSKGAKELFRTHQDVRIATFIVLGSVPTAIMGLVFHDMADRIFGSVKVVGVMLLITGTFLWLTRYTIRSGRCITGMRVIDSLLIGIAQGLAIMPGISRSGATISAAMFLGVDRQLAGRFSFLLSIPAILGALVLEIDGSVAQSSFPVFAILLGSATAAVVGFIALKILLGLVKRGQLHYFAPYCWLVGSASLILGFKGSGIFGF